MLNILYLMIPMALALGVIFVVGFFWAASNGQLDDLETPAHRILYDDLKSNTQGLKGKAHDRT
ncbi:MAG: cbb3-type cytochrome oxidase assembly protein CcoS [Pseudobdellovibrio sp.]